MSDLIERLNAGIAVCDRRLPTARTQQDIEVALVFREILVETRDEIERLGRELTEARDGIKEVMTDHAATLERLDEALQMAREDKLGRSCGYCEAIEAILTRTDQPPEVTDEKGRPMTYWGGRASDKSPDQPSGGEK